MIYIQKYLPVLYSSPYTTLGDVADTGPLDEIITAETFGEAMQQNRYPFNINSRNDNLYTPIKL